MGILKRRVRRWRRRSRWVQRVPRSITISPIARYSPVSSDAAAIAIDKAILLAPEDPWIQALAGRIDLERGDYAVSVERLRAAIRLRPVSVQAHRDLARAYRALGHGQEAQTELEEALKLEKNGSGTDDPP